MTKGKGGTPEKGMRYVGDNRGCFYCSNSASGDFFGGTQKCEYHLRQKQIQDYVCYAVILSPCWLILIAGVILAILGG